jgi:hypothetical protein
MLIRALPKELMEIIGKLTVELTKGSKKKSSQK